MIVLALAACLDPERTGTSPPDDDVDLCADPAADAAAEPTSMPTVFRVRWTTAEPTRGRVVFDDGAGTWRATAWDETAVTGHEALLVGLLPDADVRWQVEVEGETCTAPHDARTGTLPVGLPEITTSDLDAERREGGFTLVSVISDDGSWATVLDEQGRYVWVQVPGAFGDPKTWIFRAALGLDGASVLYNLPGIGLESPGKIVRVGLDGEAIEVVEVPGAHTDFAELSGGRLAVLGWDIREFEGRRLLGDTVLLVEDGVVTELWNVFDHFDPDLSVDWLTGFYIEDPTVEDWSHVNGIAWDAATDDLLVTMIFDEGVARIDVGTGEMEWVVATLGGDFVVDPAQQPLLEMPHSVQDLGDDHLLVFNRGDPFDPDACSEAIEVVLDHDAGTATEIWSSHSEECLYSPFLGQARRLPGGNTSLDFSASGVLSEVTPEGETVARFALPAGAVFGFADPSVTVASIETLPTSR